MTARAPIDEAPDGEEIRAEIAARTDAGKRHRYLFTAISGTVSLALLPWWLSLCCVLAIFVWEAVVGDLMNAWFEGAKRRLGGMRSLWIDGAVASVGALFYVAFGAVVWLQGGIAGQILGFAWIVGCMLHAQVYLSSVRQVLVPVLAPSLIALALLPLAANGLSTLAMVQAFSALTLALAAGSFASDRNALLREIAVSGDGLKAAQAERDAKSRFMATVSHELRTPLNAIQGYADLLLEDIEAGAAPRPEDARRIKASANHLLSLINDVLDMARAEAGKLTLEPVHCDLDDVLDDVAAVAHPLAARNGNVLRFQMRGGGRMGSATLDPLRLRQCLLNLLSNAAKFTAHGSIDVMVWRADGTIRFDVSDTGIGIAPEALDRLFRPFSQVDGSATRRFEGSGLGLAITRELARAMGGDVRVASVPGVGSTFTLVVRDQSSFEAAKVPDAA
jgi:signal transduction histidine kinase